MPTILVTGASGFIASQIVRLALKRGYQVIGTVRDPTNPAKTAHLRSLEGAADNLELVKADLLTEGSFDEAAARATDGVFHTASPFFFNGVTDPEAELLEPAVKGTTNVLSAVKKAGHRPRVVVTSSIAAIFVNGGALPADHVYTEDDWSLEDFMREKGYYYPLSKTLAERAAWKFLEDMPEEEKFSMVTVNPVLVTGTMLQPSLNTSNGIIKSYLDGSRTNVSPACLFYVDVDDVAESHLAVFENKEATGRHICAGKSVPYTEVVARLRLLFPAYASVIPTELPEGKTASTPESASTAKLEALGVKFTGLDATLTNTVRSLEAQGLLSPPDTSGDGAGAGEAAL